MDGRASTDADEPRSRSLRRSRARRHVQPQVFGGAFAQRVTEWTCVSASSLLTFALLPMLDRMPSPIDPRLDLEAEIRGSRSSATPSCSPTSTRRATSRTLPMSSATRCSSRRRRDRPRADVILFCGRPLHGRDRQDPKPRAHRHRARRSRRAARSPTAARAAASAPGAPNTPTPSAIIVHQLLGRGEGGERLHLHVVQRREDRARVIPDRGDPLRPRQEPWPLARWRRPAAMRLWQGSCIVHETFSLRKIVALRERHPGAKSSPTPSATSRSSASPPSSARRRRFSVHATATTPRAFIVATESGHRSPDAKGLAPQDRSSKGPRRQLRRATPARS